MRRLVAVAALAAALAAGGCASRDDYVAACRISVSDPTSAAAVDQCATDRAASENQRRAETTAAVLLFPVILPLAILGPAYAQTVSSSVYCSTYTGRTGNGGTYSRTRCY